MGFFQNLKEDLSEAMNELIHSDEEEEIVPAKVESGVKESAPIEAPSSDLPSDEELNNDDVAALLASLSGALEEEPESTDSGSESDAVDVDNFGDPELDLSGLMEQVKEASAQSEALLQEAEEDELNKRKKSKSAFEAFMKSSPFGEESTHEETNDAAENVASSEPEKPHVETIAEALKHKNDPKPVKEVVEEEELPSLLDEEVKTVSEEEAAASLEAFMASQKGESVLDDAEETTVEEATVEEETTVEKVTVEEAVAEDAIVEEVASEETTAQEPVAEEVTVEAVATEEATVEEFDTEETTIEDVTVEEAVVEETVTAETVVEETIPAEPTVEESDAEATIEEAVTNDASEVTIDASVMDAEVSSEEESVDPTIPGPYLSKAMVELPLELGVKTDETAIIAKGMVIKGDVHSNGNLDIYGDIYGDVNCLGKLNLTGRVNGNIKAGEVFADGAEIDGIVNSEGTLKVGQSSVILGDVWASRAVIAGAIKGNIDVHGPVVLDSSAIIMGDIKSQSVQINNGAVIEGKCSQCYAAVNPSSFFADFKKGER